MTEDEELGMLAGTPMTRHLIRGGIGFGLLGAALALLPMFGLPALLLAPLGMVALGGCPTCWLAGLVQTISANRLERSCTGADCALRSHKPYTGSTQNSSVRATTASRSPSSGTRRSSTK